MGSNHVNALIARALSHHRENRIEKAEAVYDQILVIDPKNPDALHLKGALFIQQGNYRQAVELISSAIVIRPDDSAFYSNLAAALNMLELYQKAQHYAEKAISLKIDSAESYVVLATALQNQGRDDEASETFKIALKLTPSNKAARKGYIKTLTATGNFSELAQFLQSRIAEGDGSDDLLLKLSDAKRLLGMPEEALIYLEQCKHKSGHDWHVHNLKVKIDLKRLDEARDHGLELLRMKDEFACLVTPRDTAAQRRAAWPSTFRSFDPTSPHRNIVCFSLWGQNQKYTYTAVLNAKLVPEIYPGWTARFYADDSVPTDIIQALRDYGAQVIRVENDDRTYLKLFWRFLAASDVNLDYFVCRDCDSIVNKREKAAVDQWLGSGKRFHIMRDHPEHAELIMAGMWGGVAGLLPNLAGQAATYYEAHDSKWRWVDQDFLRDHVWPIIRQDCLSHDSQYLFGSDARPFPAGAELKHGDHVGGYVPASWTVRA